MQPKKNPKISLESKKSLFFQIGLAVTLVLVLIAFEWKSYEKNDYNLGSLNLDDMEEEIIPITRQEVKPPPPPPRPPEVIEIVEDEVEIENEVEIEDTETDEDEIIEIEEEDDEEFFMVVENMPEFPGGDLGLMKFIQKNVKYPAIAK
jgi:protein TonB